MAPGPTETPWSMLCMAATDRLSDESIGEKAPSSSDGVSKVEGDEQVACLLCFETIQQEDAKQGEVRKKRGRPKKKSLVHRSPKYVKGTRYLRGIPAVSKRDEQWNVMFKRLQDFKHQYGHCNVPQGYTLDPELATWVKNQRQAYRYMLDKKTTKRISPDRVTRLNHVGFEWRKYVRSVEWKPPKRMQPTLTIPNGLYCNESL
uniref:Helicase-associated domain-containing protein n=1 Tax=Cyclophora tenuis TaxID=216820 RepID=A0A7S1DAI3_CYCTE|mmetsp:Transcript_5257/g.9108  ORF Transcript_5257/g.9108 Transcript_5257/m.9108 type:complete len:203 (+) Transcript_5257:460-1068(+)